MQELSNRERFEEILLPHLDAAFNLARWLTRNDQDAEKELRQAIDLSGDKLTLAHYYLGGLYWQRRDYRRAADELETYLRLTPNAPDAERVRGTVKELRAKL